MVGYLGYKFVVSKSWLKRYGNTVKCSGCKQPFKLGDKVKVHRSDVRLPVERYHERCYRNCNLKKIFLNRNKFLEFIKQGIRYHGSQRQLGRAMGYKGKTKNSKVPHFLSHPPAYLREITVNRLASAMDMSFKEVIEQIGGENHIH